MSVAVLLLTALLPAPAGATTFGPPYQVTSLYTASYGVSSGCAQVQQFQGPQWSPATGRGVLATDAYAKTCGRPPVGNHAQSSVGQWSGNWVLLVPVHLLKNRASQTVNASWAFAWTVSTNHSVTKACAGKLASSARFGYLDCSADASTSFYLLSYLVDLTNGAYYFSGAVFPTFYNFSYAYNDTYCDPTCHRSTYSLAGSGPVNASAAFTFHFTLANVSAADQWDLGVLANAHSYASVTTAYQNFTGVVPLVASARASLDFATGSNGATLTAIVVS